jgi:hypothetical protein
VVRLSLSSPARDLPESFNLRVTVFCSHFTPDQIAFFQIEICFTWASNSEPLLVEAHREWSPPPIR